MRTTPRSIVRSLTLALTLAPAALRAQLPAAFPLEAGEVVASCSPGPNAPYVVGIIDIRDPLCDPTAVPATAWPAPMYHNEMPNPTGNPADEWTQANVGSVFALTLDDASPANIYAAATSVWGSNPGGGNLMRLDGRTGAISVFARLPNSGPALGDVAFDRAHGQFFVSNHEDGRLYRLDRAGAVLETFDPFAPDDGTTGFAPLGERLWAVGVNDSRVYFSVWVEDAARRDLVRDNEIWSVGLDGASGAFVAADLVFELSLPVHTTTAPAYSNPVADIAFADGDLMSLVERSMGGDAQTSAHNSRHFEYSGGHRSWVPSAHVFLDVGSNTAGGVDYDCPVVDSCNTGRRLWMTGDALSGVTYGMGGWPAGGGDKNQSYYVQFGTTKTRLGDVEAYRPVCVAAADAGPDRRLCALADVVLDGRGSSVAGCTGSVEYRWLDGAREVCGWSTQPTCTVRPVATSRYRLEVRCGRCPCFSADEVLVALDTGAPPPSLGNTLLGVRLGGEAAFSWTAQALAATYNLYRATLKSAWPPTPLVTGLALPSLRLPDVPSPPPLYYYRATGVSCAGVEGP